MCDFTNAPGGREAAMVVFERNEDGNAAAWCDPCIEPIVRALNTDGLRTVASCCGHFQHAGWVMLEDGRTLTVWPNHDEHRRAGVATQANRLSTHSDSSIICNCDEDDATPLEAAMNRIGRMEDEQQKLGGILASVLDDETRARIKAAMDGSQRVQA